MTLIKKWDICAGAAILRALGGRLTTLSGSEVDYSGRSGPRNEGGVLATMHDHQAYVDVLGKEEVDVRRYNKEKKKKKKTAR